MKKIARGEQEPLAPRAVHSGTLKEGFDEWVLATSRRSVK
jgi:hypothetical protein